jgi:hypothetical protein
MLVTPAAIGAACRASVRRERRLLRSLTRLSNNAKCGPPEALGADMIVCENESRSDPPRDERLRLPRAADDGYKINARRDSPTSSLHFYNNNSSRARHSTLVEKEMPLGHFQVWVSVLGLFIVRCVLCLLPPRSRIRQCSIMTLHLCLCMSASSPPIQIQLAQGQMMIL